MTETEPILARELTELFKEVRDAPPPPTDIQLEALYGFRADLGFVNRGFAPIVLPRVVARIFEIDQQCRQIMFDPDHRNTGARRLCEYAGGLFLGEHDMANRRMALYTLPRPSTEEARRH